MGADLAEALADEEDAVDEQAVGGALDLEVAEEGVGAEEREHLVEDVVRLGVRVRALAGWDRRAGLRQHVRWAPGLGAEGQQGEVADETRDVGVVVEHGVVGLWSVLAVGLSGGEDTRGEGTHWCIPASCR